MTTEQHQNLHLTFNHPDYAVGCGGTERAIGYRGKSYLYVWNRVERKHEYYVAPDDLFIPDNQAPWMDNSPEAIDYNKKLSEKFCR